MDRENIKKFLMFILFANCIGINVLAAQTENHPAEDIKEVFEREYGAYIEATRLDDKEFPFRSTSYGPRSYQHLQKIAKLGMPVLPYLMEKIIATEDMNLNIPIYVITTKTFAKSEWPEGKRGDSRTKVKLYINWWKTGRKLTPQQFSQRYLQWKNLKTQGKEDEAKAKLDEIRRLGIAALPIMIEKVKQGEKEFIPLIFKLTKGKVKTNATISECLAWWRDNKEKWLIPFPNTRPVAKAEIDKVVKSGDTVQLDGSASSDADKDELTYRWTQIAGPLVKLSDETTVKPTFTAPEVQQPTLLIFQLTVEDGSPIKAIASCESGRSKPDIVTITVNPRG